MISFTDKNIFLFFSQLWDKLRFMNLHLYKMKLMYIDILFVPMIGKIQWADQRSGGPENYVLFAALCFSAEPLVRQEGP